jgi:hypothetical protein
MELKLRCTNRSPREKERTYDILRTDELVTDKVIGKVRHSYRPKNAGGPAWQATIDMVWGTVVYSPTLPKLGEIIRYVVTKEGEPPAHWR